MTNTKSNKNEQSIEEKFQLKRSNEEQNSRSKILKEANYRV